MKKAYLFAPLAALLVFVAIYLNFQSGYKARDAERQARVQSEKKARLDAEVEARRKAVDDAVRAQEVRKKEREAKEAAERRKQEARQAALDTRDKAFREQEKITRQIDRLKKDLAAEKEALAKLVEIRASGVAEQAFLKAYLEKAEANVKSLQDVITKLAQAQTARREAEAAAKKNS
ncbi:MAG TPA: hypothetical protein VIO38_13535 [Rariglobus sp.]